VTGKAMFLMKWNSSSQNTRVSSQWRVVIMAAYTECTTNLTPVTPGLSFSCHVDSVLAKHADANDA
jgi:hypothetical protein